MYKHFSARLTFGIYIEEIFWLVEWPSLHTSQENNIDKATAAKFALEQKQRMDAAQRKEDGIKWETTYFTPEGDGGGNSKWHYNSPLHERMHQK